MQIEVGGIAEDELDGYRWVSAVAFAIPPDAEADATGRAVLELDRLLAARHDGRIVGTAGAYSFELTVPGGATLPAAGVSDVTVASTHRRRGILRRLVQRQLDDVAARGEPLAVLNASEAGIYGRFGYGLASLFQTVEIATPHGAFGRPVPEPAAPLRLVPQADASASLAPLYDAARRHRPGAIARSRAWWDCVLGPVATWKGGGDLHVVVLDPDDRPGGLGGGYAIYTITPREFPRHGLLEVREVVAADPGSEAVLWRFLLDIDLVGTVRAPDCPIDLGLRWWLADPRQARVTRVQDYLWVRLLDVARALAARRYPTDAVVVLDVVDDLRAEVAGRYRLEAAAHGASCERLADDDPTPADLSLGVEELGAVYLGGTRLRDLEAAGRVVAYSPDALERADAAFAWPVAPHSTTRF
ncbi:MAG: GNAT family N-acetyltransferase [Acidimicrobiales bacterium]